MEVKLCECGCGQPAPIAKYTSYGVGWIKGQPKRFIHGHAVRGRKHTKEECERMKGRGNTGAVGESNVTWKGNTASTNAGRKRAQKDFPMGKCTLCGADGKDRHHRDGNSLNNNPENIKILCRKCHMTVHGILGGYLKNLKLMPYKLAKPETTEMEENCINVQVAGCF